MVLFYHVTPGRVGSDQEKGPASNSASLPGLGPGLVAPSSERFSKSYALQQSQYRWGSALHTPQISFSLRSVSQRQCRLS